MIEPAELMRLAIEKAREGIALGQTPFGCAIARDDRVLAVCHNTVLQSVDITAHAEINALRAACQAAGEILLEGTVAATTCEPCPMCMSALHWARVGEVHYGAAIADAAAAGFNELPITADHLVTLGGSPTKVVPDLLRDDCRELFAAWQQRADWRSY